jgi:hypothetical protein
MAQLGSAKGSPCPLSHDLLADALGLNAVHINRVLRQLSEDGLLTFRCGNVVFDDFDRSMELAEFDKTYLDDGPMLR